MRKEQRYFKTKMQQLMASILSMSLVIGSTLGTNMISLANETEECTVEVNNSVELQNVLNGQGIAEGTTKLIINLSENFEDTTEIFIGAKGSISDSTIVYRTQDNTQRYRMYNSPLNGMSVTINGNGNMLSGISVVNGKQSGELVTDLNADGSSDRKDMTVLRNTLVGIPVTDEYVADANLDAKVNLCDLIYMKKNLSQTEIPVRDYYINMELASLNINGVEFKTKGLTVNISKTDAELAKLDDNSEVSFGGIDALHLTENIFWSENGYGLDLNTLDNDTDITISDNQFYNSVNKHILVGDADVYVDVNKWGTIPSNSEEISDVEGNGSVTLADKQQNLEGNSIYSISYENTKEQDITSLPVTYLSGSETEIKLLPDVNGYENIGWSLNGKTITVIPADVKEDITLTAVWKPITYTATFMDGTEIVKICEFTVENLSVDEPEVPQKAGYKSSWEAYELKAEHVVIQVERELITYTATFKDGEKTVAEIPFTVESEGITNPTVPEKEGYVSEWASYVLGAENITIPVVRNPITYKATFMADGKEIETIEFNVETADDVAAPSVPAKVGYEGAWEQYDLGATDITINAIYTPIEYTATFVDGEKTVGVVKFTVENEFIIEPEVPEQAGYTGKWEDYELKAEHITIKTVRELIPYTATFVVDGKEVAVRTFNVENMSVENPEIAEVYRKEGYECAWESYTLSTEDITIKLVYNPIPYTVTFTADGETVETIVFTVENAKDVKAPAVPDKEGYDGSWPEYSLGAGSVEIKAVYTAHEYTATFMDGTSFVGTMNFTIETTQDEFEASSPAVPVRDGYTGEWEEFKYEPNDIIIDVEWTIVTYTVTFIVDGEVYATRTFDVNNRSIEEPPIPELPDVTGYAPDWESYTLTLEDKRIELKYYPKKYTVTFVDEDENIVGEPVEFTYGDENIEEPPVPEKLGNTGTWQEYSLGAGDLTIRPVYTPNEYTITFEDEAGNVVGEPVEFTYGATSIVEPDVPEKEGNTGVWTGYDLTIPDDQTAKPYYTPNKYTATFVDEKGVVVGEPVEFTYGDKIIEEPSLPERDGYAAAWEDYKNKLSGAGDITVNVIWYTTKFENIDSYLYRVGNQNTVTLGSLFKVETQGKVADSDVKVTVAGDNASGTYTNNASDWTKSTLKFDKTGIVKVTMTIGENGEEYVLPLEVVDATNATNATSATANNVVLLNDCGFSTISVSNGYTLYGNGFTLNNPNDVTGDSMSSAYVTLTNGTLDNVQIICPNFSLAIMYNSQAEASGNVDSTAEWRFHNFRSAVTMNGKSNIYNSYISGGRAAVYVRSGNATIANSTIHGGALANIHVSSAQSLTMRDVNLIQEPTKATVNDTSKTLMGFSVVVTCGGDGSSTPITLEGELLQYAWANETYSSYVPTGADSIINTVLRKNDFKHTFAIEGGVEDEWLNLGIAYMPAELGATVNVPTINDNRSNKDVVPYEVTDLIALGTTAQVYSYKNSKGTNEKFITKQEYVPEKHEGIRPSVSFKDTDESKVFVTEYNETSGWASKLAIDLDAVGSYSFNFSNLLVQKYGKDLGYTVVDGSGNAISKDEPIVLNSSGTYEYVLQVVDNLFYNAEGELIEGQTVTYSLPFTLVATMTSIAPPEKVAEVGGTPLLVVASKNSDWSCALPALDGAQIKYWSVADKQYKTLVLSELAPTSTGKQNGTNNYWTYSAANGDYTLTITCGVIHEGKGVYGMPVVVNNDGNKLYFTISSTTGYVSTNTTARAVTISYKFEDNNGGVLDFSKTWQFNYADYKDGTQYLYSSFVNGKLEEATSSSGGCVTPNTLITLADGSQVRVDSLTGNEQLLVWNMETGKLDSAPIMFVDNDPEATYEVIKLYFSDGTEVKVISEHGFWDYDLNKYVYLDRNAAEYIGHTFAKQNGDVLERVQLVDVVIENEVTTAWSPVTAGHLCYFVNGMLSMPGGVGGLFNIFDVDAETMTYDYEAIARDIETYGLFTYEELSQYVELPREMFDAAGGQYLKISIGKGNMTMDELITMIQRYNKFFG